MDRRPYAALAREDVYIYPTRMEDQFGNSVLADHGIEAGIFERQVQRVRDQGVVANHDRIRELRDRYRAR